MSKNQRKLRKKLRRQKRKPSPARKAGPCHQLSPMRTPKEVTQKIMDFGGQIVSGVPRFQFNEIHPDSGALPNQCHLNVFSRCDETGGTPVFGWSIWECEAWIEADFHSVWKEPSGRLVDLTPDEDGERKRLFLFDPARTWSQTERLCPPKRYFPKLRDLSIIRFCKLKERQSRIWSKYKAGQPVGPFDASLIQQLEFAAQFEIAKYLAPQLSQLLVG